MNVTCSTQRLAPNAAAASPDQPRNFSHGRCAAWRAWLLLGFLTLATSVWGGAVMRPIPLPSEGRNEAAQAARTWLELLDAGKFEESHTQADNQLKKAANRRKWVATMRPLREPLGAVTARQEKTVTLTREIPGAPDAQYAIVEFATDFAQRSAASETVTLVWGKDGRWRVTSFTLR